jgi:hypothetical protein
LEAKSNPDATAAFGGRNARNVTRTYGMVSSIAAIERNQISRWLKLRYRFVIQIEKNMKKQPVIENDASTSRRL